MTSALALSTFFTMPCYWACVKPGDFEEVKNYVFGPEGSEKRQQYAGLIAKIDNYQHTVRDNLEDIIKSIPANNKKLGIIAKYGFQIVPLGSSLEVVGDQYASVTSASFGATTSPSMFTTLSADYIAQKEAAGEGKYISPDKMIDASTCLFPDYTWFTKGVPHSTWSNTEDNILLTVTTADRQYTVDDLVTTQFMVNTGNVLELEPMTAENCHTETWEVKENPTTGGNEHIHRTFRFLASFITWIKYLIAFVKTKLG